MSRRDASTLVRSSLLFCKPVVMRGQISCSWLLWSEWSLRVMSITGRKNSV
jgi:hypothetical protein